MGLRKRGGRDYSDHRIAEAPPSRVFRKGLGEASMALPSVLVVGSDPECRQTLTEVLGLWGMGAMFVPTLAEARKTLLEQRITLIFCESNLPDGGRTDLIDAAASKRPVARLVAILHSAEDYAEALREGAFEAVLAPCQTTDIQWAIIKATLAERRTPQDCEDPSHPGSDSVPSSSPTAADS
jgi:DNA-binding NtrC family response regulator